MGLSTPWLPRGWLLPAGLILGCQKKAGRREQVERKAHLPGSDACAQQWQHNRKKIFANPQPAAFQVYNQ
jgi:hypothetical protein